MAEDTDRTGMVQQELTAEEWDARAAKLAEVEQERIDLLAKKKTHNRKWNEELIQKRETIAQLTEEVNTRTAWVPAQRDMFGGAANDDADGEADEAPAGRRRRRGRRGSASGEALPA